MEKIPISQPLGFRQYLQSRPAQSLDIVPFFDVLLIAFFIALNSSRFVTSPGVTIDLVQLESAVHQVQTPTAVLTVDRNELYFFNGLKISSDALNKTLVTFADEAGHEDSILLIKADSAINTESLFELFEVAKEAGFIRVQLAAEVVPEQLEKWENSHS